MKELKQRGKYSRLGSFLFSLVLGFFFLIPYFIFLKYFRLTTELNAAEVFWAFKNSLRQAGLAALVVTVLSIPMSQALFSVPASWARVLKRLLILPQVLPTLFSILIALSLWNPFPMGLTGVVFVFVLVNLGFSTLLLHASTCERLGSLAVISELYSLSRYRFYRHIYFPLLKRDLLLNFFVVLIFCFSSFSVPLIVSGGKGANLEVLIYEKIFIEQNWPAAFSLSLIQSGFIFFVSFLLLSPKSRPAAGFSEGAYLRSRTGVLLVVLYLGLYIGSYLRGVVGSFASLDFLKMYFFEMRDTTWFTLKTLLVYLSVNVLLLILWVYDYIARGRFTFASHLISPSTMLVGFSLYLVFPAEARFDILKIVLAMTFLQFAALFKFFLQKPVESLEQQILVARIFGLSRFRILLEVVFRQLSPQLYLWLSLLTIWFLSDYAILKSLGVQTQTLGLMSEGFLSSYRLPLSYLMSLYIFVLAALVVWGVSILMRFLHVIYKKFEI